MSIAVSCPRCGGQVRPPDLMHTEWRCAECGPVLPFHATERVSPDILAAVRDKVSAHDDDVPMWCPWPLPQGWMVTGAGWAGDDRGGVQATAVAVSGPAPVGSGPADVVFVAERPGVGLGTHLAGLPGTDPGGQLTAMSTTAPQAKVRAAGHPTPLWSVASTGDRSTYVGEAKGLWLMAIAWPNEAGYLLADEIILHDLTDSMPSELVYGAPSPYLHGGT